MTTYRYDYTVIRIGRYLATVEACKHCRHDFEPGENIHMFVPSSRHQTWLHVCDRCASSDPSFKPVQRYRFDPGVNNWVLEPFAMPPIAAPA